MSKPDFDKLIVEFENAAYACGEWVETDSPPTSYEELLEDKKRAGDALDAAIDALRSRLARDDAALRDIRDWAGFHTMDLAFPATGEPQERVPVSFFQIYQRARDALSVQL